jgi:hypothetical protein
MCTLMLGQLFDPPYVLCAHLALQLFGRIQLCGPCYKNC